MWALKIWAGSISGSGVFTPSPPPAGGTIGSPIGLLLLLTHAS